MLINCSKKETFNSVITKQSSDFTYTVFNSVSSIQSSHWNEIATSNNEFLSTAFLGIIEKNTPENIYFHYVIIYDQDKPVAIAYFQAINLSMGNFGSSQKRKKTGHNFLSQYIKKQLNFYLKKTAGKINLRLLICGNAFISGENGIAYKNQTDTLKINKAICAVAKEISEKEKENGKISAIMIKDFYKSSHNNIGILKQNNYSPFLVDPNMAINIKWDSFDAYLDAMNKKYRSRTKNIIRKGIEMERKKLSASDIKHQETEIFTLYQQVRRKAKFKMGDLTSNYFSNMKAGLADKFEFTGYFHHGHLIGFKTAFINDAKMEAHFIGMDYQANQELELYQNMLYDYVKESISLNIRELVLGRTASEIKSAVGAEPKELICYIRHRNTLSNSFLSPFLDCLKPSEWIQRKPFKQSALIS